MIPDQVNFTPIGRQSRRGIVRELSPGAVRPITVLDWRAYFREFCRVHGSLFPIPYRGRLLFPDGWTYSATDHRGPEWPPPEDRSEHLRLIRHYWTIRKRSLRRELWLARDDLDEVRRLGHGRSAPIQQATILRDEATGQMRVERHSLDVLPYETRIAWLETAIQECDEGILSSRGAEGESDGVDERKVTTDTGDPPAGTDDP